MKNMYLKWVPILAGRLSTLHKLIPALRNFCKNLTKAPPHLEALQLKGLSSPLGGL